MAGKAPGHPRKGGVGRGRQGQYWACLGGPSSRFRQPAQNPGLRRRVASLDRRFSCWSGAGAYTGCWRGPSSPPSANPPMPLSLSPPRTISGSATRSRTTGTRAIASRHDERCRAADAGHRCQAQAGPRSRLRRASTRGSRRIGSGSTRSARARAGPTSRVAIGVTPGVRQASSPPRVSRAHPPHLNTAPVRLATHVEHACPSPCGPFCGAAPCARCCWCARWGSPRASFRRWRGPTAGTRCASRRTRRATSLARATRCSRAATTTRAAPTRASVRRVSAVRRVAPARPTTTTLSRCGTLTSTTIRRRSTRVPRRSHCRRGQPCSSPGSITGGGLRPAAAGAPRRTPTCATRSSSVPRTSPRTSR